VLVEAMTCRWCPLPTADAQSLDALREGSHALSAVKKLLSWNSRPFTPYRSCSRPHRVNRALRLFGEPPACVILVTEQKEQVKGHRCSNGKKCPVTQDGL